jgi:hypothetical protein
MDIRISEQKVFRCKSTYVSNFKGQLIGIIDGYELVYKLKDIVILEIVETI